MSIATSEDAAWDSRFNPAAIFREWRRREPYLAGATLVYLVACLPVLFAMQIDERTYLDISVWIKPLKFLTSIACYFAVLVWFAGYLPAGTTEKRWYRLYSALLVACATLELIWIIVASAAGIGSHFNTGTALMSFAYTAAGIGAVTLITGALVYGVMIWRNPTPQLSPGFRASVIAGLLLTFPLTFVAAGYLGGAPSHFVGGNASDAEGMILTGWARDGGDLRVAHFFALHAIHFLPLLGLATIWMRSAGRAVATVWTGSAAYVALTAFTFIQALNGEPFLAMIP
ncbi:MAG: hypothetical protein AAFN79_17620 [Pseudomonadota bacterium]